jgi:hypothetical protein
MGYIKIMGVTAISTFYQFCTMCPILNKNGANVKYCTDCPKIDKMVKMSNKVAFGRCEKWRKLEFVKSAKIRKKYEEANGLAIGKYWQMMVCLCGADIVPRLAFAVGGVRLCRGCGVRGLCAILVGLAWGLWRLCLCSACGCVAVALNFRLCWLFGFSVGLVLGSDALRRLEAIFKPFTVGAFAPRSLSSVRGSFPPSLRRSVRALALAVGDSLGVVIFTIPLHYYIMRARVGALLSISHIKNLISNTRYFLYQKNI